MDNLATTSGSPVVRSISVPVDLIIIIVLVTVLLSRRRDNKPAWFVIVLLPILTFALFLTIDQLVMAPSKSREKAKVLAAQQTDVAFYTNLTQVAATRTAVFELTPSPYPLPLMDLVNACMSANDQPTGRMFAGKFTAVYNINNLPAPGDFGEAKEWEDMWAASFLGSGVPSVEKYGNLNEAINWREARSDLGGVLCLKVTYVEDKVCSYGDQIRSRTVVYYSVDTVATLYNRQTNETVARTNIDSDHWDKECPETLTTDLGLSGRIEIYKRTTADGQKSMWNALKDWLVLVQFGK